MKIKFSFSLFILCVTQICILNLNAMEGGASPQDPLIRMNYRNAFAQERIQERFREFLRQNGCAENVFGTDGRMVPQATADSEIAILILDDTSELLADERQLSTHCAVPTQEQREYEKACLKKLYAARRWAITEDAREALTIMVLLASATVVLQFVLPPDSMGGSFGIFAVIFNTAFLLRPTMRSLYNLVVSPAHPLNRLEELFAKNQCFIPRVLWPIIIEKFMLARTNPFEQRKCIEFLNFTLELTTCKPKPTLTVGREAVMEGVQGLFSEIDNFFTEYEAPEEENLWMLKQNILNFIKLLLGEQTEAPKYIHLHGVGGIGKTHFVNHLSRWIDGLISGSVRFENLVISSEDALEGSGNCTGVMLNVLRNQLMENKRGSVVFIDEATWLNSDKMIDAAKRVFNGDQSTVSTKYFGDGLGGSGIDLEMPPMLIFTASNEQITDPALRTRFATMSFPSPQKETLVRHAYKIAAEDELVITRGIDSQRFDASKWLRDSGTDNFRDVKSRIVPAILAAAGIDAQGDEENCC